jgi:hypothetical protein
MIASRLVARRATWLRLIPSKAELTDELVDPPRGDADHVGISDHRHERLFGRRRGCRSQSGTYDPCLSLGTGSSTVPTRVSQARSRYPLRMLTRAGGR